MLAGADLVINRLAAEVGMDEKAFLRAIRAAPGDLAIRQVYADWLEDRGDPRAAWVRLEARLRAELARLEDALRPLQNVPPPPEGPGYLSARLDQAGVGAEVPALMLDLLAAYVAGTDEQRRTLRALVPEFRLFFHYAHPPDAETAAETTRRRLIHFALIDQYPDPRDALLWLQELCEKPGVSLRKFASLRREVASMTSDENRYGFGSTRSLLLHGYRGGYGKRGAPEPEG
jgi:uncharacterized protein (TIGR02996 family)